MRGGLNLSFIFLLVLKPAEFKGEILKFKAPIRALNLLRGRSKTAQILLCRGDLYVAV